MAQGVEEANIKLFSFKLLDEMAEQKSFVLCSSIHWLS